VSGVVITAVTTAIALVNDVEPAQYATAETVVSWVLLTLLAFAGMWWLIAARVGSLSVVVRDDGEPLARSLRAVRRVAPRQRCATGRPSRRPSRIGMLLRAPRACPVPRGPRSNPGPRSGGVGVPPVSSVRAAPRATELAFDRTSVSGRLRRAPNRDAPRCGQRRCARAGCRRPHGKDSATRRR
jgi:hypothetical protein